MTFCRLFLALLLCLWGAGNAHAQAENPSSLAAEYERLLEVSGHTAPTSRSIRVGKLQIESVSERPAWDLRADDKRVSRTSWLSADVLGPSLGWYYHSARPGGQNDGATWQGRGSTLRVYGGLRVQAGPLQGMLAPSYFSAENVDFTLAPFDNVDGLPFSDRLHQGLDLPQRLGVRRFSQLDLGSSSLMLTSRYISGGVSHAPLWWGPGRRHALLFTDNAGGFPHTRIHTEAPLPFYVGDFRFNWMAGWVRRSAFTDTLFNNRRRFITGLAMDVQGRGAFEGLSVGFARAFAERVRPGIPLPRQEYLLAFKDWLWRKEDVNSPVSGDDQRIRLMTWWGRWVHPEAGVEVYGEWGWNNRFLDDRDRFIQGDHGRAWLAGFQKTIAQDPGTLWRIGAEWLHLEAPRTESMRNAAPWYTNPNVPHGWTHRGQVLGAASGPGSSVLDLEVDRFTETGRMGLLFSRTVRNNDALYRLLRDNASLAGLHEVDYRLHARVVHRREGYTLGLQAGPTWRLNEYFQAENDIVNWHVGLSLHTGGLLW